MSDARGHSFLRHAPEATRRLASVFSHDPQGAIDRAEAALAEVEWHDDVAVAAWVVSTPFHGTVALSLLADAPLSLAAARLAEVLPELAGLALPTRATTYEHERSKHDGRPTPLLDRAIRAVACAEGCAAELDATGKSLVTVVLLFSDVAKGGSPAQRETWRVRLGVDGTVHNEDSAVILDDVIRRVLGKAPHSEDGRWAERAKVLCAASGLVGMRLRGEVGRDALAVFHDFLKSEPDGGDDTARIWSIVNKCETNAVRSGLWTPELATAFADEEHAILLPPSSRGFARSPLGERIARMRGGALMTRESAPEVEAALDRLRGGRPVLESRLAKCRIWYAEAALGALSLDAATRLLLHLSGAAVHAGIDTTRPWHLDLLEVVTELRDEAGGERSYPVRLLEAVLDATKVEELLLGKLAGPALVSFASTKGGEHALAVRFEKSPEASALLTLLSIYERKASAAFHQTLKALCDLYALRKDDFDRVHNEQAYLVTMNAARSDKARMLDLVKPGTIVEVGPGGGVVLELLAERFAGSRIVGLDASKAVVEAHAERTSGQRLGYEMMYGDAFELPTIFGRGEVDTVVFCSVLHEIFSYVPWGDPPKRFCLDAVDAMVGAAFRTLKRGGRILVRDGVMPPDEPRVLEFVDPSWREGLDLFQKAYEPREIKFEILSPTRVRMSARDAYEFLTTYTWGPDSFPYEVREQRAVLPRGEYVARMIAACKSADPEATVREVPVEVDLQQYLQPGYPEHITPHVRILDGAGEREIPMDPVNGVWAIERV
ncbi:MAG: methyltransferase domain-containing protein [Myxococcales bacterium]|nr:methyltransferase domain-containing protein [Myxococcales bacterium]